MHAHPEAQPQDDVQAGAGIKEVDPDTYSSLFDDDLDAVAVTLDGRYSPGKYGQIVGTEHLQRFAAKAKVGATCDFSPVVLAVAEGFEPSDGFSRHTLSRRAP